MTSPRRRMWLYVPDTEPDAIEVTVIGAMLEIGQPIAMLRSAAERWPGFHRVEIIGAGTMAGILRCVLTPVAVSDDPIAEFLAMWVKNVRLRVSWSTPASASGMVGTW